MKTDIEIAQSIEQSSWEIDLGYCHQPNTCW